MNALSNDSQLFGKTILVVVNDFQGRYGRAEPDNRMKEIGLQAPLA